MPPVFGTDLPVLLLDLEQGERVRLVNLGVSDPLVVREEAELRFAIVENFRFGVEDSASPSHPTVYGGIYDKLISPPRFVVWRERPHSSTSAGLSYGEGPPGLERLD